MKALGHKSNGELMKIVGNCVPKMTRSIKPEAKAKIQNNRDLNKCYYKVKWLFKLFKEVHDN